jgi:serine/tyrosine/threonine adenylyltransferase
VVGGPVPEPRLLALKEELAPKLGADAEAPGMDGAVDVLGGDVGPDGASPVVQAYAGHQFGMVFAAPRRRPGAAAR